MAYDTREDDQQITLTARNRGAGRLEVTFRNTYSGRSRTFSLRAGESRSQQWSLARSRGWYDLEGTVAGGSAYLRGFGGHVENGEPSISDPRMGGLA